MRTKVEYFYGHGLFVDFTRWLPRAITRFEIFSFYSSLYQKGFKYSHRSYYFDNYKQADAFYAKVMETENDYFDEQNSTFFAPRIDCFTQTNGLKKSIHFVYHPCPIKQTELDPCSKTENLLSKKIKTIKNIESISLHKEIQLESESYLRFRTGWRT